MTEIWLEISQIRTWSWYKTWYVDSASFGRDIKQNLNPLIKLPYREKKNPLRCNNNQDFFFNRKGNNNKGENPNMTDKNYLPQIHKSTIFVLKQLCLLWTKITNFEK